MLLLLFREGKASGEGDAFHTIEQQRIIVHRRRGWVGKREKSFSFYHQAGCLALVFSCSLNGSVFLFSEVEWTEIIAKRRRIRRWCHWEPRIEFNECHWFHWTIELVLARFFFSSRPCDALRREVGVGLSSMVPSAVGIYFFDLFWRYQMLFHASIAAHKWIAFYLMEASHCNVPRYLEPSVAQKRNG